jgi:hypothetical protein
MTDWPHYHDYQDDYARRHARLDRSLYELCEEMLEHRDFGEVRAKVVIIGRSYASGLERHAGGDPDAIVAALVGEKRWLDPAVRRLRALADCVPSADRIENIAAVHKRLQDQLDTMGLVRSFVSKYLHFHAPVVPIFDNLANTQLKARNWYRWKEAFDVEHPCGTDVDRVYWQHCVRTARIVADWRNEDLDPTARKIDYYVMRWRSEHRNQRCRACGTTPAARCLARSRSARM